MALTKMISDEKPAAVLIGSEKEYGLLNMSTYSRDYQLAGAPVAYVARENYRQLWRLLDEGPVQVEVNIEGKLSGKPVEV